MIRARFDRRGGTLSAVQVTGHAGYAPAGGDIVCASVTSAVQLVCNGVTEVLNVSAGVETDEDTVRLTLPPKAPKQAADFLEALLVHLELLRQDYPKYIQITVVEV